MLTKLKLALLIAAPLVAGASTYAAAQATAPAAPTAAPTAPAHPLDASRAERHKAALATYDTNKDGKLDDAERSAMRDAKLAARFTAMDADHDGTLSLAEFKAGEHERGGSHRHARHHRGQAHGARTKP